MSNGETAGNKSDRVPLAPAASSSPHIFISHDTRDAELAEAFSKLLKSVSAGMIKTFRSSDKKGSEGIEFGEEWFKRLMTQLQSTTDVVCLFAERSLDRPWILFEAGVAKGKLSTPVIGVALGVPLSRVSAGPFYQFMNMDDSEPDLAKLVHQLSRRIPGLELDDDVVRSQVAVFKEAETTILQKLARGEPAKVVADPEEVAVAKLAEEMKSLPSRVAERLSRLLDPERIRRSRKMSPGMIEELISARQSSRENAILLIVAATHFKEEAPWLYELSVEAYRAISSLSPMRIDLEIQKLSRLMDVSQNSYFMRMFVRNDDAYFAIEKLPQIMREFLLRALDEAITMERNEMGSSRATRAVSPGTK